MYDSGITLTSLIRVLCFSQLKLLELQRCAGFNTVVALKLFFTESLLDSGFIFISWQRLKYCMSKSLEVWTGLYLEILIFVYLGFLN